MPFRDDPVSATSELLASSRERIRLSRLLCQELRISYDEALESILRSHETILRNELSMTPELVSLVRCQHVIDDPKDRS